MNIFKFIILSIIVTSLSYAGEVSESQQSWYKKYKEQKNVPDPAKQLLNTDKEPNLTDGFTELYNGKDLSGWLTKGGTCKFEAKGDMIVGTCVKGSPGTYLSTAKDYDDFIFTCELKWIVESNSGVMFRAKAKKGKKGSEMVYGPQAEMESPSKGRGWSGGVYGQACGGFFYPLWLDAHKEARAALKKDDWNRITIEAKGKVVKTWINGIPASHIVNEEYLKGFFALQIHAGTKGTVQFRTLKVKELK
ncbi:DUF1080 domain-containing protein [Lentisphaera marina]|uniref:3-keto-disaccharide hydrolase n=1 Tax=Lentisphaera marina TaxID=1111041 RepID=UPI002365237C|nr:DUF1080 domain-containing protein [Lentisphaera marina]MDD7985178.1 DUF1080 domain-containing protein [Lentisphaera marina]